MLETLSTLLPRFSEVNALEFDLDQVYITETSLLENLQQNNAVYHRSCYKKHNQQKLERAIEKFNNVSHKPDDVEISNSPPVKRRSMTPKSDVTKKRICCFCKQSDDNINLRAAGTLHATQIKTDIEHVTSFAKKWLLMA